MHLIRQLAYPSPLPGVVALLVLSAPAAAQIGIESEKKISETMGGFAGVLQPEDRFGVSLTSMEDLDGDGNIELAVGAHLDDDGGADQGAVWIVSVDPTGKAVAQQKISELVGGFGGVLDPADQFGVSVAWLNDLDGDGDTELAVGAHLDDDGGADQGAVWILSVSVNGTVTGQTKISETSGAFGGVLDPGDQFGISLAAVGDLDGDGILELAVGAVGDDDGGVDQGAVWILFLNPDGTVKSEPKISETSGGFGGVLASSDWFGRSVAGIDDLNGDSLADIAVGAMLDDDGGTDQGAVWIVLLNGDGTVFFQAKISETSGGFGGVLDTGDAFGISVSSMGDADCKARGIAVGAAFDDDGGADKGALWFLFLDVNGAVLSEQKISATAGEFAGALNLGDAFGISVAPLSDMDGDAFGEMVAGAYLDDDGGADQGAAWLLFPTNCLAATSVVYCATLNPSPDTLAATPAVIGSTWTAVFTRAGGPVSGRFQIRVWRERLPLNGIPASSGTAPWWPTGTAGRRMTGGLYLGSIPAGQLMPGTPVSPTLPFVGGSATVAVPIPLDYDFVGLHFACQARSGTGVLGRDDARLSCAVEGTVGTF